MKMTGFNVHIPREKSENGNNHVFPTHTLVIKYCSWWFTEYKEFAVWWETVYAKIASQISKLGQCQPWARNAFPEEKWCHSEGVGEQRGRVGWLDGEFSSQKFCSNTSWLLIWCQEPLTIEKKSQGNRHLDLKTVFPISQQFGFGWTILIYAHLRTRFQSLKFLPPEAAIFSSFFLHLLLLFGVDQATLALWSCHTKAQKQDQKKEDISKFWRRRLGKKEKKFISYTFKKSMSVPRIGICTKKDRLFFLSFALETGHVGCRSTCSYILFISNSRNKRKKLVLSNRKKWIVLSEIILSGCNNPLGLSHSLSDPIESDCAVFE